MTAVAGTKKPRGDITTFQYPFMGDDKIPDAHHGGITKDPSCILQFLFFFFFCYFFFCYLENVLYGALLKYTVFCLIRAPGALTWSDLIGLGKG